MKNDERVMNYYWPHFLQLRMTKQLSPYPDHCTKHKTPNNADLKSLMETEVIHHSCLSTRNFDPLSHPLGWDSSSSAGDSGKKHPSLGMNRIRVVWIRVESKVE